MVLSVLKAAVAAKKRFSVYVTESQPDLSGQVSPCGEVLGEPLTESKLGARLQPQRKQKAPHELPVSSGSWEQNTLDSEAVKPEEQPFDDGKIFCVSGPYTQHCSGWLFMILNSW